MPAPEGVHAQYHPSKRRSFELLNYRIAASLVAVNRPARPEYDALHHGK